MTPCSSYRESTGEIRGGPEGLRRKSEAKSADLFPLILPRSVHGGAGGSRGRTRMKSKSRPCLSPRLALAAFASTFLFLHSMGDAFGGPSFEGYVGSFVAAISPEVAPEIPFFDADRIPPHAVRVSGQGGSGELLGQLVSGLHHGDASP